jgi:hypothetical protein
MRALDVGVMLPVGLASTMGEPGVEAAAAPSLVVGGRMRSPDSSPPRGAPALAGPPPDSLAGTVDMAAARMGSHAQRDWVAGGQSRP